MSDSFPANWSRSTRPYLPVYFDLTTIAASAATFAAITMSDASDAATVVIKSYSGLLQQQKATHPLTSWVHRRKIATDEPHSYYLGRWERL